MPTKEYTDMAVHMIHESFRPFVVDIFNNFNFGLNPSKGDIEIFEFSRGFPRDELPIYDSNPQLSKTGVNLNDRFTLILPYAGDRLKWEILFDSTRPWLAPDFRFDDKYFLSNVNAKYLADNIPSLAKWNSKNTKSLSLVLTEFLALYKKHQINMLSNNEQAFLEYTSLIENSINEEDIEVLVTGNDKVTLLIKLNINHSQLPINITDLTCIENPGKEWAFLIIKYPYSNKPNLLMSPLLSNIVGKIYLPDGSTNMIGIVLQIIKTINEQIETFIQVKRLSREFFAYFVAKYENSVLEHDSNSASFLFETNDFYCILHITSSSDIKKKPLNLTLRSVYYSEMNEPFVKELTVFHSFPIEKFFNDKYLNLYLMKEIALFKCTCEVNKKKAIKDIYNVIQGKYE